MVLMIQHYNYGGKLTKVGGGNYPQKFNAESVKPILYNIFSYILFNDSN